MTPDEAHRILESGFAPWIKDLRPQITAISAEGCTMVIPVQAAIKRMGGIADTSMVFACFGHLGTVEPVGTVTLDTQFMRPASGDRIRAEAVVTRAGKTMIFTRVRLIEEPSGKDVAHATATFAR